MWPSRKGCGFVFMKCRRSVDWLNLNFVNIHGSVWNVCMDVDFLTVSFWCIKFYFVTYKLNEIFAPLDSEYDVDYIICELPKMSSQG